MTTMRAGSITVLTADNAALFGDTKLILSTRDEATVIPAIYIAITPGLTGAASDGQNANRTASRHPGQADG
jgi:hypothetical protein